VDGCCEVCGIPLGYRETCPSPSCPCFGLRCGAEMEAAAERWRSRPSVAQGRAMTGSAALEIMENRAWLELMDLRGITIDLEIEHR
jgi:hypothetical protein